MQGAEVVLALSALLLIAVIVSIVLRLIDKKADLKTPHIYVVWRDINYKHQVQHWQRCWCFTGLSYQDTYQLASVTFTTLVGVKNVNMEKVANASQAQVPSERTTDVN